jgi:glutaminyl-peptide cyclotransferase
MQCYFSGVPILHMIVLPFPSVWHKASDAAAAIDMTDTENVNKIIRVFVAEYMQLTKPTSLQRAY